MKVREQGGGRVPAMNGYRSLVRRVTSLPLKLTMEGGERGDRLVRRSRGRIGRRRRGRVTGRRSGRRRKGTVRG